MDMKELEQINTILNSIKYKLSQVKNNDEYRIIYTELNNTINAHPILEEYLHLQKIKYDSLINDNLKIFYDNYLEYLKYIARCCNQKSPNGIYDFAYWKSLIKNYTMLESVTTRYYVEYKNQSFLEYQKAVLEYISKDYDNKDIWKSVMLQSKDKKITQQEFLKIEQAYSNEFNKTKKHIECIEIKAFLEYYNNPPAYIFDSLVPVIHCILTSTILYFDNYINAKVKYIPILQNVQIQNFIKSSLSEREAEIFEELCKNQNIKNKELAKKFCISQKTVETHKSNIKSEAINYFNITEDIKKISNLIDALKKLNI